MPAITTAAEGFQLARALRDAANAISDSLFANWDKLTPAQRDELDVRNYDLHMLSGTIRDQAVGKLLEEAQLSIAQVTKLTERARRQIKAFDDVRRVVKIATALFGLAAAITQAVASPSGPALQAAFKNLQELLKAT
jgi:hypothetical protein